MHLLVNLVLCFNLPLRVPHRYVHFQQRNKHFLEFEPEVGMWRRTHPRNLGLPWLLLGKRSMIWRTCNLAKLHVLFDNSRSFRSSAVIFDKSIKFWMRIRMISQSFSCMPYFGRKVTLKCWPDCNWQPDSSRDPIGSKRAHWLFISPPLVLVAKWLLIWGLI